MPFYCDLQEEQHAKILPAVMGLMDDFANPRVQAHACAAVVNFAGALCCAVLWLVLRCDVMCLLCASRRTPAPPWSTLRVRCAVLCYAVHVVLLGIACDAILHLRRRISTPMPAPPWSTLRVRWHCSALSCNVHVVQCCAALCWLRMLIAPPGRSLTSPTSELHLPFRPVQRRLTRTPSHPTWTP